MREVRPSPRRRRAVKALSVDQARDLLRVTRSHQDGAARDDAGLLLGGTRRTPDLHDVVLVLLGTGMRIGEALALEWADLDLDADVPCVRVAATMVEPRRDAATGQVFVAGLHRQPMTKTGAARTIALPSAAVAMLNQRRARMVGEHDRQPVFAREGAGWLWPNNVRTKLRGVVADTPLAGVSPHALRRTVGTLVAHGAGLDAARDVLGHRDPSVTARHAFADIGWNGQTSTSTPTSRTCVHVDATLVEPRRDAASGQVFVAGLHRQPMTKTGANRAIALPGAAVAMLNQRRARWWGSTIGSRSSPARAQAGCGRTTCGPSSVAWSRTRHWLESAHMRYVARWAPWSRTVRAWTPPGTF